jgi:hypothetical protein
MTDICPCIDCILIPICRHKMYMQLFKDCCIVKEYVPKYDWIYIDGHKDDKEIDDKVREICLAIDPVQWYKAKEYKKEQ